MISALLAFGYAVVAVQGRWHALYSWGVLAVLCAMAGVVAVILSIAAAKSVRRIPWVCALLTFGLLCVGTDCVSRRLAATYRDAEIANAIADGLVEDCESLFVTFRDHPDFEMDGHVRLFPGSDEFDALPNSIRRFEPVYVTIEENRVNGRLPLNVGLCKNGFGGFHMGVRVFRTTPNIRPSENRVRIAPKIYLWIDET